MFFNYFLDLYYLKNNNKISIEENYKQFSQGNK